MPARFAKDHAPIPLQIRSQTDSATPTARATYEFVEAAARGSHLGEPISDKVTSHSYETMYAQFLSPLHASVQASGRRLKLLEIGMGCDMERAAPARPRCSGRGCCPAQRCGKPSYTATARRRWAASCRCACWWATRPTPPSCEWVQTTGGGFDAIIDDGGHRNDQQDLVRRAVAGALPGGVYFVEDLHVARVAPRRERVHGRRPAALVVGQLLRLPADEEERSHRRQPPRAPRKAKHPMPSDVAFVFVQRDAAVIGKLTSAGRTAQQAHLKFLDVGGGPLKDADEQRALTTIVKPTAAAPGSGRNGGEAALRGSWQSRAAAEGGGEGEGEGGGGGSGDGGGARVRAADGHDDAERRLAQHIVRRAPAAERARAAANVRERPRALAADQPALPIVLVENSGDNLTWANDGAGGAERRRARGAPRAAFAPAGGALR